MKSFKERVLSVVKSIPRGGVFSYGEVARYASSPKSARAVGAIMRYNQNASIPCHRVIRSDGSLGGYNGFIGDKITLLRSEGVMFSQGKILRLAGSSH